ncbi:MAG TPA: nicotinate-nucleotide adenylyltransferase [Oscillospiraceae bacterium]|nr:nicotinate-nucleotide adenylyltransferase [Oscillospiraceae bacterium]
MTIQLPECMEELSVGIMGGTFDPIHLGHLVIAEEVRLQYNLDKVIFVPTGYPPHKVNRKVTDPEHRYLMTVLATINNPFFTVSRVEIDRAHALTYTIDTLRFFNNYYNGQAGIYFITGADAIMDILNWKDYQELFSLCHFIAVTRPGYNLNLEETIGKVYPEALSRIEVLEIPAMQISSTLIRQRVVTGKPIRYLTPDAVTQYIFKNGLYRNERE